MKRRMRLPSPAMVVAIGALAMSAGGTVTAAALITSADIEDNTIRSVDIRDGTLKSIDVTNGSLTGADVRDGKLTGTDVANNSLTGADINESTLGQVPSAANATNAQSATNAQNAGKVDGLDADSLIRVARMGTGATLTLTSTEKTFGTALSITAPRAGFVMIHGSITIFQVGCTTGCGVLGRIRHIQSNTYSMPAEGSIDQYQAVTNLSHAWVFPVNAGVNTFDIRIGRFPGDGVLQGTFAELAAIYSPFGSTGA